MGSRTRIRGGAVGVLAVAALAASAAAWPAPAGGPRTAAPTERQQIAAALPRGFRICAPRFAAVSNSNGRFGAVVAKRRCAAFASDHFWLRRATARRDAPWRIVDRRPSRLGKPPGCTRVRSVPLDIRCW
jgi:hypothetical protein